MNGPKLGALIDTNEKRDAIHIAVLPVTAHERLKPGMHVRFAVPGNTEVVRMCHSDSAIGIIDPFLTVVVEPGQRCWLFMMPNTITSLRHEWEHPHVDGTDVMGIAEFWLRDFCAKYHLDYDFVIHCAKTYDGRISTGDNDVDMDDEDRRPLAENLSILVGKEVPITKVGFSCAC
jgi:hypothetical protein